MKPRLWPLGVHRWFNSAHSQCPISALGANKSPYKAEIQTESSFRFECRTAVLCGTNLDENANNAVSFHYRRGYQPPPIGVWGDPDTFNTLLIHPLMFVNHSPPKVARVIERLFYAIMEPENIYHSIGKNTYFKENKPVQGIKRHLTTEDKQRFCRIRKLK